MGLDSVELLIGFEEAFGVRFTDDEAARMTTIGETADIILVRLQNEASNTCRTRSSFYTIRKALGPTIDSRHLPIQPATQLAELLPRRTRRADWSRLSNALGTDCILPLLHRPPWCKLLVFAFVVAMGLGSGLYSNSVGVACLAGVLTGIVGYRTTAPLAHDFERGIDTVGQLARWWVSGKDSLPPQAVDRDSIVATVIRVTCGQLGLKQEDVKEDMSFVNDLGLS